MKKLTINDYFFLGILIVISYCFINLLIPFIIDIFIAVILYIIFRKPFAYLLKKTKNRKKASIITIIIVTFVVAVPLFFIGLMVSFEAGEIYNKISDKIPQIHNMLDAGSLIEYANKTPLIGDQLSKSLEEIDLDKVKELSANIISAVSAFLMKMLKAAFFNITSFFMHLFFTPFILFFLFLDGKTMMSKVRNLMPFEREDEKKAAEELVKITDTIVIYTFLIGVAEGIYGGFLFFIMGIGSPFFWSVIMVILSMLPVVGANTIIVPAAVLMIISGSYAKGIILLVLGSGAILINQNVIKPKLTGDKSGLHPVVMLVSSIGGIAWIGITGFIAGPLIAAFTIVAWELFASKFKTRQPESETE
jgi:predicted PurR-regulated permease PerM